MCAIPESGCTSRASGLRRRVNSLGFDHLPIAPQSDGHAPLTDCGCVGLDPLVQVQLRDGVVLPLWCVVGVTWCAYFVPALVWYDVGVTWCSHFVPAPVRSRCGVRVTWGVHFVSA